jgi:AraC-like DNA-binding protein
MKSSSELDRDQDLLSSALRSLQISGTLLLREIYSAPWAVTIPAAEALAPILSLKPGTRVVAFHLVEFGHCEVKTVGGTSEVLQAGEMMICFGGEAHRICEGSPAQVQTVQSLLCGEFNTQHPNHTGKAVGASVICGVFMLQHVAFNPLLTALPPLMRSNLSRSGALNNLSGIARMMMEESDQRVLGGGYVVERLLEVLCAQAIRSYIHAAPRFAAGWVRAIQDPIVGRAMTAMHARPANDWSVPILAKEVAMSPSRFAARFSESLGDSPMAYLTKLRMNAACKILTSSQLKVEQIASEVGYESSAAFSRAFKNYLGLAPGAWRTQATAT